MVIRDRVKEAAESKFWTCTTNNHILLRLRRIWSSGLWNESVDGSVRGRGHGGEDGPTFFSNFVAVAVLDFLNQTMVTKQAKLAADGGRPAARFLDRSGAGGIEKWL